MNQELLFWRVLLTLPLLSEALDLERAFEEGKFQAINIEGYHLNIKKIFIVFLFYRRNHLQTTVSWW